MKFTPIIILPPGTRAKVSLPNPTFYKNVGEEGIRKMINDHYEKLITSDILHLFPTSGQELEDAKRNAADFFVQYLGGPKHYNQRRGAPMMVRRHNPFKITAYGREVWLQKYQEVLSTMDAPEEDILSFWEYLNTFSIWMINDFE